MDVLTFLGIYEYAIETIVDTCNDAIDELMDTARRHEYEADTAMIAAFNLDETAKEILRETIDADNLTNCIISAYLTAVMQLIKDTTLAKTLGIDAEIYVNCDDSHLYIKTESTTYTYSDGVLEEASDECFICLYGNQIFEMISCYLKTAYNIPQDTFSYKDFENDFADGLISMSAIRESINDNKLTDDLIEYLNDVANSLN